MDPNTMSWHHVTLLHDAAWTGWADRARLLIDHGADLNAVDEEYQSTPLGFAARFGNVEMVELLLDAGADPGLSGAEWSKPLVWAERKGHRSVMEMLS